LYLIIITILFSKLKSGLDGVVNDEENLIGEKLCVQTNKFIYINISFFSDILSFFYNGFRFQINYYIVDIQQIKLDQTNFEVMNYLIIIIRN